MSHTTSRKNQKESGFTLIELMLSMVVFGLAISSLVEISIQGTRFNSDAQAQILGSQLGHTVLDRLASLPYYGPNHIDNSPLLNDIVPGNERCADVLNGCAADHGILQADLNAIFDNSANGNPNPIVVSQIAGRWGVWYEGFRYYLIWNIESDVPFVNSSAIELMVIYMPNSANYSAADESLILRNRYTQRFVSFRQPMDF